MASQRQTTLQDQLCLVGIDFRVLLREMSHSSSDFSIDSIIGHIHEDIGDENRPSSSQTSNHLKWSNENSTSKNLYIFIIFFVFVIA